MSNLFDHIDDMAGWLAATDIDRLELEGPAGTIRLTRGPDGVVSEFIDGTRELAPVVVRSPGVGVFLERHPLRRDAQAPIGAEVGAHRPVGFLRIGPLVTAITAPARGIVTDVFVRHGAVVGYGTPLFELQSTGSDIEP